MLDVVEAQRVLARRINALTSESLALVDALERTLAEPVCTDIDQPPFDRSMMDGYAVRSADVADAPCVLRLAGSIAAGGSADVEVGAGEAVQMNTGAPLPRGADAVVRLEDTELLESDRVQVRTAVAPGNYITRRATYAGAGRVVLPTGARLTGLNVAAAAAAGAARVVVYRKPSVAILSTGDELVEYDQEPRGPQIRNSNRLLLTALLHSEGLSATYLGIARDDATDLRTRLEAGSNHDVVCITGGVSVGPFDFVPAVLRELGATIVIQKLAIKPGRPILVAQLANGGWVFALPGNPVSAFVGFELLVRPTLGALQGRTEVFPSMFAARLSGSVSAAGARRSFSPARLRVTPTGTMEVAPLAWRGSGDVINMAEAEALIMRPPHAPAANSGEEVMILQLQRPCAALNQEPAR